MCTENQCCCCQGDMQVQSRIPDWCCPPPPPPRPWRPNQIMPELARALVRSFGCDCQVQWFNLDACKRTIPASQPVRRTWCDNSIWPMQSVLVNHVCLALILAFRDDGVCVCVICMIAPVRFVRQREHTHTGKGSEGRCANNTRHGHITWSRNVSMSIFTHRVPYRMGNELINLSGPRENMGIWLRFTTFVVVQTLIGNSGGFLLHSSCFVNFISKWNVNTLFKKEE